MADLDALAQDTALKYPITTATARSLIVELDRHKLLEPDTIDTGMALLNSVLQRQTAGFDFAIRLWPGLLELVAPTPPPSTTAPLTPL